MRESWYPSAAPHGPPHPPHPALRRCHCVRSSPLRSRPGGRVDEGVGAASPLSPRGAPAPGRAGRSAGGAGVRLSAGWRERGPGEPAGAQNCAPGAGAARSGRVPAESRAGRDLGAGLGSAGRRRGRGRGGAGGRGRGGLGAGGDPEGRGRARLAHARCIVLTENAVGFESGGGGAERVPPADGEADPLQVSGPAGRGGGGGGSGGGPVRPPARAPGPGCRRRCGLGPRAAPRPPPRPQPRAWARGGWAAVRRGLPPPEVERRRPGLGRPPGAGAGEHGRRRWGFGACGE